MKPKHRSRPRRINQILGESRTQQHHAEQSDINYIVDRFQRSGQMPPNPRGLEPQYIDCTPLQDDLTEALNKSHEDIENYNAALAAQEAAAVEAEAEKEANAYPSPAPEDDPKPKPTGEGGASPPHQGASD